MIARQAKVDFFEPKIHDNPIEISYHAMKVAKIKLYDILIFDTAGILHIDNNMMQQIKNIKNITHPIETLFVLNSMMGQNAIHAVKNFNKYLDIPGIILTKIDSDTQIGSALSVNYILKKPIKFIGTGKKYMILKYFNQKE